MKKKGLSFRKYFTMIYGTGREEALPADRIKCFSPVRHRQEIEALPANGTVGMEMFRRCM